MRTYSTVRNERLHDVSLQAVAAQSEALGDLIAAMMPHIAELEQQLASRPPRKSKVIERVEVPVIGDEQLRSLEAAIMTLAEMGGQLVTIAQDLKAALARVAAPAPTAEIAPPVDQVAPAHALTLARPQTTPAPRPAEPTNGAAPASELSLRAGERKMLRVLAQRYPMRFTRTQLGTLAGNTASGGTGKVRNWEAESRKWLPSLFSFRLSAFSFPPAPTWARCDAMGSSRWRAGRCGRARVFLGDR